MQSSRTNSTNWWIVAPNSGPDQAVTVTGKHPILLERLTLAMASTQEEPAVEIE